MKPERAQVLRKDPRAQKVEPRFRELDALGRPTDWSRWRAGLEGLPGGGLNLAWECVERHARGSAGDRVALVLRGRDGARKELRYGELARAVRRFANALRSLGVEKGDRVFLLLDRKSELFVAAHGALARGCVVSPLFSAFGPEPIAARLALGDARVLVTTTALHRRKLAGKASLPPGLAHVLVVEDERAPLPEGTLGFHALLERASEESAVEPTAPEDPALLHFTSGTTGTPKGALHVHGAAVMHSMTGEVALDLRPGDVYWCTADPGWVTGTSYGLVAPLLHGVTSLVDEADFDAARWYRLLAEERVSVWYTAPTAIRMLIKAGAEARGALALPDLRFIASVGEPLHPEAVWWAQEALGLPIHDNWWQTETGGIMIANLPLLDIKPGSMGKPLPGVEACLVRRLPGGGVERVERAGEEGELALRVGWPSMFRAYVGQEERYRSCFSGDLYLSGDLARRDEDGYFWFVGRADDVIKSAGHLIGPFEVESALLEHPAVAEAAVIGLPDPLMGEIVKAFVALKGGQEPSDALASELLGFARKRLGAAVAPKQLAFANALPRTRSGKILRRLLKARELGLEEGDLSTLEGPA